MIYNVGYLIQYYTCVVGSYRSSRDSTEPIVTAELCLDRLSDEGDADLLRLNALDGLGGSSNMSVLRGLGKGEGIRGLSSVPAIWI